jgi:WD40 repeat protein
VVHLIDLDSGKAIRTFTVDNPESELTAGFAPVLGIAFSPDGTRMATGGYDNDQAGEFTRLWDVASGQELRRFRHTKEVHGIRNLVFSADGKTLATLGQNAGSVLRLYDVDTGQLRRAFPRDGDGDIRTGRGCVAFSPDGKTVAAACASIRLYDASTGQERLRIDRKASGLHFTDDGKTLTAAVACAIYQWDTTTGKALTPDAGDSGIVQILVSADGSRVVTRGEVGDTHIWEAATGKHLHRLQMPYPCLAISPDGRFLAWPVADHEVTFSVPQSPGSVYYGTRIRFHDLATGRSADRIRTFKGDTADLVFTKDGNRLVTVEGHAGMVRVWNLATGEEERSFPAVPEAVKNQAYFLRRTLISPDGKTVVKTLEENRAGRLGGVGEHPYLVQLWDVATGKELPRPNGGDPVDGAFSPDGRLVVTQGENAVCKVATGERVATLPEGYIRAAAFSPDGRLLATTGPGDAIQVYEVASWTKRNEFKGHRDPPTTLTFAPNGQLLSGSRDTTVLLWDLGLPHAGGTEPGSR